MRATSPTNRNRPLIGSAASQQNATWGSGMFHTFTVPSTAQYTFVHGMGFAPRIASFESAGSATTWWVVSNNRTQIVLGFGTAGVQVTIGLSAPAQRVRIPFGLTHENWRTAGIQAETAEMGEAN